MSLEERSVALLKGYVSVLDEPPVDVLSLRDVSEGLVDKALVLKSLCKYALEITPGLLVCYYYFLGESYEECTKLLLKEEAVRLYFIKTLQEEEESMMSALVKRIDTVLQALLD